MAEAFINLTEGSGKKAHAWDRTIGANTVLDEFTLPGEYPLASYTVYFSNISIATANDHVLQIMAGSSLNVRIRRIWYEQNGNATTAARDEITLLRLTTAGTGGTTVTPAKLDNGDSAAGATAMTLPTAKGTEGTILRGSVLIMRQAIATTGTQPEEGILWEQHPGMKPWIIPAGTSNGIAIKHVTAIAGANVNGFVDFVETSF